MANNRSDGLRSSSQNRANLDGQQGQYDLHRNVLHPGAPKLVPRELPAEEEQIQFRQAVTISHGDDQLLPMALLFQNDATSGMDARLAFHKRQRPVAQPTITFMPEYPEYLWGAVGHHITRSDNDMRVHFEAITEPATNPPASRMRIVTEFGDWFVVEPQDGCGYVTVQDVQRRVIRWMQEISSRTDPGETTTSLSRWVRIADWDGAEIEVEVWMWKGLMRLGETTETWCLKLGEI